MANITQGTWNMDTSHSRIGFSVKHAGISKVRGEFTEAESQMVDGRVRTVIKIDSFNSGDSNRDGHVKGEDFFNVKQYPEMVFDGYLEGEYLRGNLTVKDVTRPVELELDELGVAIDPFGNARAGTEARAVISRKDFGLTWNAALETGGVLVGDKVTITLDVSFIKE